MKSWEIIKLQLEESTRMLKSPSRRVDGNLEHREVRSSVSSDEKVVEALGVSARLEQEIGPTMQTRTK